MDASQRNRLPFVQSPKPGASGSFGFLRPQEIPHDVIYILEESQLLGNWSEIARRDAASTWSGAGAVHVETDSLGAFFGRLRMELKE